MPVNNIRASHSHLGFQWDGTWESISTSLSITTDYSERQPYGTQPSLSQRFGKQLGGFPGAREIAGPWGRCDTWMRVDPIYYHMGLTSQIVVNCCFIRNFWDCHRNFHHRKNAYLSRTCTQDQPWSGNLRRSQALTPSPRLGWNTSSDGSSMVIPF